MAISFGSTTHVWNSSSLSVTVASGTQALIFLVANEDAAGGIPYVVSLTDDSGSPQAAVRPTGAHATRGSGPDNSAEILVITNPNVGTTTWTIQWNVTPDRNSLFVCLPVLSGADVSSLINAVGQSDSGTSPISTGITTSVPGCEVVGIVSHDASSGDFSAVNGQTVLLNTASPGSGAVTGRGLVSRFSATTATTYNLGWTNSGTVARLLQVLVAVTPESTGGTGSGAVSLPLAATGLGSLLIAGAGALSLGFGLAGSGSLGISGTGALPVPIVMAGTGTHLNSGSGAVSFPIGASGTGRLSITGNGAVSFAITCVGTGGSSSFGTGSFVFPIGALGAGRLALSGVGDLSFPLVLQGVGTGGGAISGNGVLLFPLSLVGGGKLALVGVGNVPLPITLVGAGNSNANNDPYDNVFIDSQVEIESIKASIQDGLSTTRRPDALTYDYLKAYTLGPETIGDAASGILGWAWYVRAVAGGVVYARSNDAYDGWEPEQSLFTYSGAAIEELDVAFEQNGRVVVCAERDGEIWLYWYNPFAADFIFEKFDDGRTPRVVLDNPNDTTISDVHLAYMQDGAGVLTRRQSEQYDDPHTTNFDLWDGWYIEEFARNRGNRLVLFLSHHFGTRYSLSRIESTLYPFYPVDGSTMQAAVLNTSALVSAVIVNELDVESVNMVAAVLSTSSLIAPVITSELDPPESVTLDAELLDTSTLAVVILLNELDPPEAITADAEVLSTSTLAVALITNSTRGEDGDATISAAVRSTSSLEVP